MSFNKTAVLMMVPRKDKLQRENDVPALFTIKKKIYIYGIVKA